MDIIWLCVQFKEEEIISFSISALLWWKPLTTWWFHAVCSQRLSSVLPQQDEYVQKKKNPPQKQTQICCLIAYVCASTEGLRCGANHAIFLEERRCPAVLSLWFLLWGAGGSYSAAKNAAVMWRWKCVHLMMIYDPFFFQNAGEGPTGRVQKGAAADRLYGVSLGAADQCIVAQKPHR